MDAVRCREWRIFPLLSLMSDKWGKIVFIVAHLPLFLIITIQLNASDNERFITGMSFFFIVHLFMHIVYLRHKNNEFNGDATFYDADGAVASKGKFVNGKKAGMWQFYTKGKLTKEVNMSDPKASYKADSKPKMSN